MDKSGLQTYIAGVVGCEVRQTGLLVSVQSEIFLRTAVTPEHTTQHGQTLNITHLTVVFKPVEETDKVKDHVKMKTRS